jgi:ketosteroid isomerase-like protein
VSTFPQEEVEAAVRRYLATRDECNTDGDWSRMAALFTDDAVFVDPAWGRVEGVDEMRRSVFGDAMVGLEDWTFPTECWAVVGDTVLIKWRQRFPGADGHVYEQSGSSTLAYAGDGKFSYEEDLLNMVHVLEDIAASGWKPRGGTMNLPPKHPNRDFSRPPH